jgi:hypothetical protein
LQLQAQVFPSLVVAKNHGATRALQANQISPPTTTTAYALAPYPKMINNPAQGLEKYIGKKPWPEAKLLAFGTSKISAGLKHAIFFIFLINKIVLFV